MANYRRVAFSDRCQIQALLQVDLGVSEIGQKLGFDRSTVYREIQRNRGDGDYQATQAQTLAHWRFKKCRRPRALQGPMETKVVSKLREGWSPDQIFQRFCREHQDMVSPQTIYRFLKRKKWGCQCLRFYNHRGGSRYAHKKRHAQGKTSIALRPAIANQRGRLGDWERDTFFTAKRKPILILSDRKTRFIKMEKLQSMALQSVAQQTRELLDKAGKKAWTMTNDNGPEFQKPVSIGIPIYYCDPRKPQQRGTVENTIGLLRQYIPRKADLDSFSSNDLQTVEDRLNLRPRKCLDYLTPYEVFYGKSVALAV